MDMVMKGVLALVWLAVVPAAAGILFTGKRQLKFAEIFLHGYLLLFAMMEILVLPMILLKMPLHVLTAVYGSLAAGFAVAGLLLWKKKNRNKNLLKKMERPSIYFWMAVLVILLQVLMCAAMAHMDADDCFYVAAATTDVHTDSIFAVDPYTGCEYRILPRRYVLSPFPVFLAVVSQLSGGLHPAIMAHMIFPVIFLPMAYLVQYCLGEKWFSGERKAKDIYLLLAACICSFSGYSVYNAGNFQMVRIWQGKAVLASVLLPYLICLCISMLLEEQRKNSWTALLLANISCCLLSSMGIILAPIMTGCFLAVSLVMRKDWKRVGKGFLCCLPSFVLGIAYILIG